MSDLDLSDSEQERLIMRKKDRVKAYKDNQRKLLADHERKWLQRRGKAHYIDFDDSTRNELRRCFKSITVNGSNLIRIDELMEPLIALGIAETRDQVKLLFEGLDQEGLMEFEHFLEVLKNHGIADVFKAIARGNLLPLSEELPFPLVISNYRRRMMMNAFMDGVGNDERVKGEKIMRAYAKLLDNRKARKNLSLSPKPSSPKKKKLFR
mmetsp:Transcript_10660/g.20669  ORF Transcript_10660/g.20669 Transcript_10660/m.20669 type:complete len:209 (+) Transcript_10660:2604-3230(+)